MNRRSFAGALAGVLAAIGLRPSSLAATSAAVPDHPSGRTILHLNLRATREFPEFPMDVSPTTEQMLAWLDAEAARLHARLAAAIR